MLKIISLISFILSYCLIADEISLEILQNAATDKKVLKEVYEQLKDKKDRRAELIGLELKLLKLSKHASERSSLESKAIKLKKDLSYLSLWDRKGLNSKFGEGSHILFWQGIPAELNFVFCSEYLKHRKELHESLPLIALHLVKCSAQDLRNVLSSRFFSKIRVLKLYRESRFNLKGEKLIKSVENTQKIVDVIVASPELRQLTEIHFREYFWDTEEQAKAILSSPNFKNLKTLVIAMNPIGPEGARAIAKNKHLQNLEHLNMQYSRIGISDKGAKALSKQKFPHLKVLDLTYNQLTDKSLGAIFSIASRSPLADLRIGANKFTSGKLAQHIRELKKATLRQLSIHKTKLFPQDVKTIVDSAGLKELESLNLSLCKLDNTALLTLSSSKTLNKLKALNLEFNSDISDEGINSLSKARFRLINLDLDAISLSQSSLKRIARSKSFSQLQTLSLSHPGTKKGSVLFEKGSLLKSLHTFTIGNIEDGDRVLKALANRKSTKKLTHLYITNSNIGDDGINALMQSNNLSNLSAVSFYGNEIGDVGAGFIADAHDSNKLPSLISLGLSQNRIGKAGASRLQAMMDKNILGGWKTADTLLVNQKRR